MASKRNQIASKSQPATFRKAARDLGADESLERFNAALKVVGKHTAKPPQQPVRRGRRKTP
jgi:hypothetical protein